jgi:tetratricopeptide (TPR) repeat protein
VRLAIALLLVTATARADGDDKLARAHFLAGRALYDAGSYQDAVREFWAGYKASPLPQFLVNLGQAYRKLDDLPHARAMYARFLKEAPADAPERPQVQKLLERVDGEISARAAPPVDTETSASVKAQPSPAPIAQRAPPSPAPLLVVERPAEKPTKTKWQRYWWLVPVGGVVVAGVVVGLAVGLTSSSRIGCGDDTIGCLKVSSP